MRRPIPELHGAPPPQELLYLWRWFLDMHMSRARTEFSTSAISNAEIKAFAELRGIQLRAFELDAIRALDLAFLKSQAPPAPDPHPSPTTKGPAHGR